MKQETEVEPLTRITRAGEALKRRPEVEQQLREVLGLDGDALRERLAQRDFGDPSYVKNECLVFMIRFRQKQGDEGAVNELATALKERLTRPIEKRLIPVAKNVRAECRDEAVWCVFAPILDVDSDSADYAQVSFGPWFDNRVIDAIKKFSRTQAKDARSESLTREDDEGEEDVPTGKGLRVGDLLAEEHALVIDDALGALDDVEREAFLMRHYWQWEIESIDPKLPTISKHFGVTPRTIRNWLKSSERKIAKWRDQRGSK